MSSASKEINKLTSIRVAKNIQSVNLPISLGILTSRVKVGPKNKEIWQMLQDIGKERVSQYTPDTLKNIDHIAAFREFYKRIGKDPSRYRPSSEMLIRRITRGIPLYSINNVVDIMNFLSIKTYLPMGLYDQNKIVGNITFRIGKKDEGFPGIRKGIVNVESLPILADDLGAFGDPSSDSERTMIRLETTKMLLVFFSCSGNPDRLLEKTYEYARNLYTKYCSATDFKFSIVQ